MPKALFVMAYCLRHRDGASPVYSFSDWLQRLRVAHACRLLADSPYQLAEIAEISGIRDQSRMTVLFHRYLNMTPREYRISSRRKHAGEKECARE